MFVNCWSEYSVGNKVLEKFEGKKDHCGSISVIKKKHVKISRIGDSLKEVMEFGLGKAKKEGFLRRDISKVSKTGLHMVGLE